MIRVGVKPLVVGESGVEPRTLGDTTTEVIAEMQQHWVEIDGVRIERGLLSVSYGPDGDNGAGSGIVTIRLLSTGFATADWREPEPPK